MKSLQRANIAILNDTCKINRPGGMVNAWSKWLEAVQKVFR